MIDTCDNVERVAKLLYILLVAFQSRVRFSRQTVIDCTSLAKLAVKYVNSSNYLCALRILDSLLSLNEENDGKSLKSVLDCLNSPDELTKLVDNLRSPFHKVRFDQFFFSYGERGPLLTTFLGS